MITNKQAENIMYEEGRRQALLLQEASIDMTGTELNAADNDIPDFVAAKKSRICSIDQQDLCVNLRKGVWFNYFNHMIVKFTLKSQKN